MNRGIRSIGRRKWRPRLPLGTGRSFVKTAGISTAAVITGLGTGRISTSELPRVSEDDPMAKALNYVHDARTVDAARRLSGRCCSNCALYAGNTDDVWANCRIFPGKVVAAQGWCNVWAPKPSS